MPKNQIDKEEINVRVLKIKNELYNGTYLGAPGEWHNGAHHMLNKVLDILQEYRYQALTGPYGPGIINRSTTLRNVTTLWVRHSFFVDTRLTKTKQRV